MKLYLHVTEAKFRHEIRGIFEKRIEAITAALVAIQSEDHDGYHDECVYVTELGKKVDDVRYIGHYRKKHISRYGDDPYQKREIEWFPKK